ncbi:Cytochrome P450 [Myxococcus fulvus]|uniref:Cytochrome P450 n=1 Tax=Myxococcus fulvus TaxID=33 RepID=A0A511TFM3_MYXFU|nr:cytochrome P450 [Myxococcus fulvus]GEN11988.1 cytochrome P450 [Myxococcus fulvus]SEU39025.1 Cytochrome P450 [Myxococcus fulvus]
MSPRINFLSREFMENPHPHLAELRRQGPVVQVDPGGIWAVTHHDEVQHVLKSPRLFSSSGLRFAFSPAWLGRTNPLSYSIAFMDPPHHGRLRALVTQAFTPKALARLESRIHATARKCVDDMLEKRQVDFVDALSTAIPASVIGHLLGLDESRHAQLKQWTLDIATLSGVAPDDTTGMARCRATVEELDGYSRQMLADRRREPREDMVSDLVQARVGTEALTDDELVGFFVALLVGGLETTVSLLSHCARMFAMRPELLPRLRATPTLIPRFVEETLRYEPPILSIPRTCTEDVTLAGVTLPKGATVLVSLVSASRDEKHFPDGDRFILERENAQQIYFGHGIHFCIGARLTRLEARIALEELVSRVDRVELRTEHVEWTPSLIVRGPATLPVELFPA